MKSHAEQPALETAFRDRLDVEERIDRLHVRIVVERTHETLLFQHVPA